MLHRYPNVARWTDTDDVLQNALIRLLRALETVQPDSTRAFFGLAAEQIRRELLDLARHYYGPEGEGAHHDSVGPRTEDSRPDLDPSAPDETANDLERWTRFHEEVERLPVSQAFNRMGGWALTGTGVAYALPLTAAGHYLWRCKGLTTPGGLLIAAAVSMVPMAIYGVQDALDLWTYAHGDPGTYHNFYPFVNGSWLYMEVGTVLAAALAGAASSFTLTTSRPPLAMLISSRSS
jgi:hypothetical protein